MSYKTILLHLDESAHLPQRIALASALAQQMQAHLVGLATSGVTRLMYSGGAIEIDAALLADHVALLRHRAAGRLARFSQLVPPSAALSTETRQLDDDEFGGLCLQARYSDLLVLGQSDPDERPGSWPEELVPYVVLNSPRPVLVVPYAGQAGAPFEQVLVAWDGGAEAARAVDAALPLLKAAKRVTVALFNPQSGPDGHGQEPGADLALYLARHGVQVEVRVESTSTDTGHALLALAADVKADLLVMGCYGHSRLREMLVGGTTRTVLARMTLPVLMAH
jgi:nucleotide-binding universal stress UspA family protein